MHLDLAIVNIGQICMQTIVSLEPSLKRVRQPARSLQLTQRNPNAGASKSVVGDGQD